MYFYNLFQVYSIKCNRDIYSGRINSQQRTCSSSCLYLSLANFHHGMYCFAGCIQSCWRHILNPNMRTRRRDFKYKEEDWTAFSIICRCYFCRWVISTPNKLKFFWLARCAYTQNNISHKSNSWVQYHHKQKTYITFPIFHIILREFKDWRIEGLKDFFRGGVGGKTKHFS